MVLPDSPRISRVRGYSGTLLTSFSFRVRGFHPLWRTVPSPSTKIHCIVIASPTTPLQKPGTVWAVPRSLAATNGVSIDFLSSGYLDVSVPQVGSLTGNEE
jgi:hypothetical protein